MAGKQVASDFEKIINEARDRKKNEALAARIFGKDNRRSSLPPKAPALGGSLAGRAGVKKRVASTGPRGAAPTPQPAHAGNINGDWTHDLHERHSAPSTPRQPTAPAASSLASRITDPNAGPAARVRSNQRRSAQVAKALIRTELAPASAPRAPAAGARATLRNNANANTNVNAGSSSSPWNNNSSRGMTIRGLAGPFVVMAQNFAPGTTAADIESAVTPVGGLVQSCRLLKTEPIVIAEIVFESKEGADNVIATFNNQTADGRLIHVYYKVGGGGGAVAPADNTRAPPAHAPSGPRASRDTVVDGSLGFDDPMETDRGYDRDRAPRGDSRPRNGLYSDSMVQSGNQRGRGYGRGRRGGPGR
ncbi:hypothetical protein CONLIGDRAFT_711576 [Coniochaeta ligniaria NRRL 30616]|uniref:RRM domain-containing protein n=1 Tax=Coniochaeta ligniaria NRRL 30616 TaxID=1408157 RepID=A0A1J7J2X9_9PEZI|nr:hypothetical protein CONLIGDRAFT_711576 [Coniochaeta ligniaria NRRL 30616]